MFTLPNGFRWAEAHHSYMGFDELKHTVQQLKLLLRGHVQTNMKNEFIDTEMAWKMYIILTIEIVDGGVCEIRNHCSRTVINGFFSCCG